MSSIEGRRILLIGGAGFIGHNLAIRLNELGARVEIVDGLQVNNLSSFLATTEPDANRALYIAFIHERLRLLQERGVNVHVQDARDYHGLTKIMRTFEPETVVHLAAIAHANKANKDPFSTFDHSSRTLENALDASRSRKPHFIYFSSSMVYGNFKEDAVTEDTECNPIGIYGALKFGGEKLVIAYNQVFGLPFTIVRPSALYGERCVSRRVIQVFIEKALRKQPITVYGNGSDKLDFTYIDDLVQGVVRVVGDERAQGQTFNLTYGNARSLMDVVNILDGMFPNLCIESEERDHLMPERGTLSIGKARQIIAYQPDYPLERAVPKYVEWYQRLVTSQPELLGD
ncbi:MAG: NAD(P)-dependent oxidoreductase [Alphaproteobacteria bacterium]|nr:NAD(P)-dependent oxidoreductase [Alphaproteobacteria bacterium]